MGGEQLKSGEIDWGSVRTGEKWEAMEIPELVKWGAFEKWEQMESLQKKVEQLSERLSGTVEKWTARWQKSFYFI